MNFVRADIKLVSSIAPTDFLGPLSAFPHEVPYHLWVGGGDSDVNGCADCAAALAFCAKASCQSSCLGGLSSPACVACLDVNGCSGGFTTCSGRTF